MLNLILISLISAVWTTAELSPEYAHPLSDQFIEYINSVQKLWRAGRNFHPNISMVYLKKRQGNITFDDRLPENRYELDDDDKELPEEFDARKQWPNCKSLSEIRDQGACGSCWAISTTEAMTDRYCIHSGGKQNFHFSTLDLQSCCSGSSNRENTGCNGGCSTYAWKAYRDRGVVSGGNYNSSSGCKPYPYRNCNHHHQPADNGYPDCSKVSENQEFCSEKCVTKDINYGKDLKKAKEVYSINGVKNIMTEIFKYGPVTAGFDVYSDFLSYKKGVYKHTAGDCLGNHVVKILGWGVENNVKYWLAANSWNEYWGDKGYFKILRGENHGRIEQFVDAGIPLLSDSS